ncbi:MAG: hypothetical protein ACREQM_18980 [Candidatus Dormibacteraceae bacterium]
MGEAPRTERNRRMTTGAGLLLVPLLLLAAATAILIRRGVPLPHLAVGLVLLPPLALKMATSGYRFARYHLGDPGYVAAGPPAPGLRPIAPPLVLSILVLMVSGLALWLDPGASTTGLWLALHKLSFLIFGACVGIHVLVHLLRSPTLDLERRLPGGGHRLAYAAASLGLGIALAVVGLTWRP